MTSLPRSSQLLKLSHDYTLIHMATPQAWQEIFYFYRQKNYWVIHIIYTCVMVALSTLNTMVISITMLLACCEGGR